MIWSIATHIGINIDIDIDGLYEDCEEEEDES